MPVRTILLRLKPLEGRRRFVVIQNPNGYEPCLVDMYRQLPSRRFDPGERQWSFGMDVKREFVRRIRLLSTANLEFRIFDDTNRRSVSPLEETKQLCAFFLSGKNSFEVKVPYDKRLNEVFTNLKSRSYVASSRHWMFSLKDHEILVQELRKSPELLETYRIQPVPTTIVSFMMSRLNAQEHEVMGKVNVEDICRQKIGNNLYEKLLPFQRESLCFAFVNHGRILLADDMGLGKTVQALAMALLYRVEWPLLIIVPSSVKFSWRDHILKWVDTVKVSDVQIIRNAQSASVKSKYLVTIVSYDTMVKTTNSVTAMFTDFRVIIVDESHFLKNVKTSRCKNIMPILKRSKRLFLLSGTPALSRPVELYTQLHCIQPNLFRNLHEFGIRYCGAKQSYGGWSYMGCTGVEELQIVLDSGIMIRRRKEQVLEQLPEKFRQIVKLDPLLLERNNQLMKVASSKILNAKAKEKHPALLSYFHATAEAKVTAVVSYVNDCLESGNKFLVFAHHQIMLDRLSELCEEKQVRYIRIDGSVDAERRQTMVDIFQADEDVKIALLAILSASNGLHLTAASTIIFAELFWNPGALMQAEDRAYRIGQRKPVHVQYLFAENTSDDHMWPLIQKKLKVLNSAGLCSEDAMKADNNDNEDNDNEDENSREISQLINAYADSFTETPLESNDDSIADEDLLKAVEGYI